MLRLIPVEAHDNLKVLINQEAACLLGRGCASSLTQEPVWTHTGRQEGRVVAASKKPVDPKVRAMLICDLAHQDRATGKYTLIGIFDHIVCDGLPAMLPEFWAYLNMAGLHGSYTLKLRVVRASDESTVNEIGGDEALTVSDPLESVEFGLPLPPGLVLPYEGKYLFRLLMNDRFVHEVPFHVEEGPGDAPDA